MNIEKDEEVEVILEEGITDEYGVIVLAGVRYGPYLMPHIRYALYKNAGVWAV